MNSRRDQTGERSSVVEPQFLDGDIDALAEAVCHAHPGSTVHRISDSTVAALHGSALDEALRRRGRTIHPLVFPAGEAHKNLDTVAALWTDLLEKGVERADAVLAFGGGVTGDIAGFVASTVLRGIAIVQAPTTTLAMCDAAIGGKTGFNLHGKNLVGTFAPPVAVLAWTPALHTLPGRELRSGLAEVVKSAVLAGEADLAALEASAHQCLVPGSDALHRALERAAALKVRIVREDLRERGVRRLLNLGHTFAHAIEAATGYTRYTHGEAVAIGLVLAARAAASYGGSSVELLDRLVGLLDALGLPTSAPALPANTWQAHLRQDKKKHNNLVSLILPLRPGDVDILPVNPIDLSEWLAIGAPITPRSDDARAR